MINYLCIIHLLYWRANICMFYGGTLIYIPCEISEGPAGTIPSRN